MQSMKEKVRATGWVNSKEIDKTRSNAINTSYGLISAMAAEFIAVATLTFMASMQRLANDNILNSALTVGSTIFVLVCTFGHISGAHFNPAVTLCTALCGKIKFIYTLAMVFGQLTGSVVGALLIKLVTTNTQYLSINGGALVISKDYEWKQCLVAEIIITFLLCQTVMNTVFDRDFAMAPLAIALTHTMNILSTGFMGISMNPAPTFGTSIIGFLWGVKANLWESLYIYWLAPALAVLIEVLMYRLFFRKENRK